MRTRRPKRSWNG